MTFLGSADDQKSASSAGNFEPAPNAGNAFDIKYRDVRVALMSFDTVLKYS